ncbi:MAG: TolC family protein [Deltaproteobacteria bacterium]|nr:TolC family protein [Deltaproteobacteria bacterium]
MSRRIFLLVGMAVMLVFPAPGHAQPAWSEGDVVRRALARAPDVLAAQASVVRAEAAAAGAGLADNPAIGYQREQLLGDPARAHDVVTLRVPLDLSGRRGARRSLARVDASTVALEAAAVQREAVAAALDAFWEAVAAGRRVQIAERAEATLVEADRVMARREAEGTVSGYERARLAIAAEMARSRAAEVRTRERVARARLGAIVDPSTGAPPAVTGDLATAAPTDRARTVDRALRTRREVREAARTRRLASAATDSAASAWLPVVTVLGGWNAERAGNVDENGFIAGVELELPVFSRGQDVRGESEAAAGAARVRLEGLRARISGEVRIADEQLVAARAELARLEAAVAPHVEALARATTAGYREGERTLLELVDAQAALAEVEERKLDLALEAKRAEVALRIATGELP